MNELAEAQKAYLAGFIDADGCIFIARRGRSHVLRVRVAQSDLPVLETFRQWAGVGSITKSEKKKKGLRTSYQWIIASQEAGDLLNALYHYFVLKKYQAELGLRLQDSMGRPGRPISDCVYEKREALRLKLKELKRVERK